MSDKILSVARVVHHTHENICYDWVSADILDYPSDYLTQESIKRFRDDYDLSNPRLENSIIVEPCHESDFICHRKRPSEADFIFLYDTFFSKLGITLPFSRFECNVLRNLNVAPSQLHPNSWAFVKSFIIVCEYFDIVPTVRKFFYFFNSKSQREIGWLSLNSVPRRGFLLPFVQSYKKFKGGFFRVRGSDDFPNLLIETDGSPLFPLYWTEKPTRIARLSEADLNVKARSEVEFLKGLKEKSIGCSDGEMAPKRPMSSKDLHSFYGLRQKRGATSSGTQSHTDQIPINVDPNTPASSTDPTQKRPRLEDNSEATSNQTHPIQTSTHPTTDADPSSLTI
ncbi:hypothetical protein SESBI_38108 [Sesbania bispinosa]|nr:hypothetical protein SESBI_38108 [Sesbania bispinosa]